MPTPGRPLLVLADYVDFLGATGTATPDPSRLITSALARRTKGTGRTRQLVAVVLANPDDRFGRDEIFGIARYWHERSAQDLLLLFPGYKLSEDTPDGAPKPAFDPQAFTAFLDWIEGHTTVQYRGLALILLAVGVQDPTDSEGWSVDWTQVFQIRIEELVDRKLVEHPKTLIEDLIRFAKNERAPDDAMVRLKDALEADAIEPNLASGIASFFTFWVPKDARDAVVTIGAAKSFFRIGDVKKYR